MAVLEDRFGWSRETNSRWQVREGRLTRDGHIDVGSADDGSRWPDEYVPRPNTLAQRTGILRERAEKIVRETIPKLIEEHAQLPEFLAALAREGISLAKKTGVSGARYRVTFEEVGGKKHREDVKASVARGWGYRALNARYGTLPADFDAPAINHKVADDGKQALRYSIALTRHRERLNQTCQDVRSAVGRSPDLSNALSQARAACAFPSFADWTNGAEPPDVGAVLFARVGLIVLQASSRGERRQPTEPAPDSAILERGSAIG